MCMWEKESSNNREYGRKNTHTHKHTNRHPRTPDAVEVGQRLATFRSFPTRLAWSVKNQFCAGPTRPARKVGMNSARPAQLGNPANYCYSNKMTYVRHGTRNVMVILDAVPRDMDVPPAARVKSLLCVLQHQSNADRKKRRLNKHRVCHWPTDSYQRSPCRPFLVCRTTILNLFLCIYLLQ